MISNEDKSLQQVVLNDHIEIMSRHCLAIDPEAKAVILYGGYGRGEGSWFRNDANKWTPYNDYDLMLITTDKIRPQQIDACKSAIARDTGIRWVDISTLSKLRLRLLRPSIFNYDLKYASTVIHGDADIVNLIPGIKPESLPMREVLTLFFTRLFTLLGSLKPSGFESTYDGDDSRFFRNQMAKAVLAVDDSLLISENAYDSSYKRRVELIESKHSDNGELLELSKWALNEKLSPTDEVMSGEECEKLYARVNKLFMTGMFKLLSNYFGMDITTPAQFEKSVLNSIPLKTRKASCILRGKGKTFNDYISLSLAQCYLAAAYSKEKINPSMLSSAIDLMRRISPSVRRDLSWDQARVKACELRWTI